MQAFGSNAHGQLGVGHVEDVSLPENCIFGSKSVIPRSVACGANHSLVISTDDELWVSGLNSHGQIGLEVEQVNSFVRLQYELFENLESVAAGWTHSLILLQNGKLYALGSNENGQCGNSDRKDMKTPVLIEGIPKLRTVICSLSTSYGLDFEGRLWGWGLNRHGELGIATSTRLFTPKCIVDTHHVVGIACGQHHLLFLTNTYKIFGLGSNKFGQLGKPVGQLSKTSHPISTFEESSGLPIQVFSGWNYSGCLLDNGNVYLWGRCDMGQLAYDPKSSQEPPCASIKDGKICDSPLLNASLKQIKFLTSGSESCFALDKDGNLFSFGWNEHGNCGCGHNVNVYHPILIARADFVASGYGCSFILKKCS